jgi:hypothetical protein
MCASVSRPNESNEFDEILTPKSLKYFLINILHIPRENIINFQNLSEREQFLFHYYFLLHSKFINLQDIQVIDHNYTLFVLQTDLKSQLPINYFSNCTNLVSF